MLPEYKIERIPSIKSMAKEQVEWIEVELVDTPWEQQEIITSLNQRDARSLGITLEELIEMIK